MADASEYMDSGEKDALLYMYCDSCIFEGILLFRVAGGIDLFLMRENSEFECLEIDQITWLRKQAQGDALLFIEHFPERELSKDLKKRIADRFASWLRASLNLRANEKIRVEWGVRPWPE